MKLPLILKSLLKPFQPLIRRRHLRYYAQAKPFLDQIPSREADLVEMHYWKGLELEDIASVFDVPVKSVKYRLGCARRRVKMLRISTRP
jgi:hypothetical protein